MKSRVLITGGTGFLGKRLGLALKNEYDVYLTGRNNKQNFTAEKMTGCKILPMDVVNIESVRDAFAEVRPDIVIHAAATKFVDLSEKQPMECTDVNVVGSQNVARVAVEKGVKAVIGISTDKAAPPVRNIYGLSKAMMERIFCSMNAKTDTKFVCVRYGNVAWSTGSVLPIWRKMHAETGVLKSTGPEMTRYFFTVDDAVQLVLTGMKNIEALQGKVLSRMMKSAQIKDILDVWVSEKGGKWEKIAGRPGDRLYECLIGELELDYTRKATYDGILHYVISFNEKVEEPLKEIVSSDNAERLSRTEISKLLNNIPAEEL
jgi:UDP-N-acetylglucosamine 4,6-dehydratase